MSQNIFDSTRKLIEQTFQTAWASRTPVRYDNVAFSQPRASEWVGLSVRWGASNQISIASVGRRLERHSGAVIVQVFVPKLLGTAPALQHADFAATIFRMKQFTDSTNGLDLQFRTPEAPATFADTDFWQVNVSVAFDVDGLF